MTYEKAIEIFERMLSHYQGELYTDSEREMKEALELGKEALETGEIYINAVDYNIFLEGYKQGKKDFERPKGEWIKEGDGYKCSRCGERNDYAYDECLQKFTDHFCPNCGAEMKQD